jgi:predicted RNase H-like HicB family nuclease
MMETRTFAAVLEPSGEGGFNARVPALPEIVTEGDCETEALSMAKDATESVLARGVKRGEAIPAVDSELLIRELTVTIATWSSDLDRRHREQGHAPCPCKHHSATCSASSIR